MSFQKRVTVATDLDKHPRLVISVECKADGPSGVGNLVALLYEGPALPPHFSWPSTIIVFLSPPTTVFTLLLPFKGPRDPFVTKGRKFPSQRFCIICSAEVAASSAVRHMTLGILTAFKSSSSAASNVDYPQRNSEELPHANDSLPR